MTRHRLLIWLFLFGCLCLSACGDEAPVLTAETVTPPTPTTPPQPIPLNRPADPIVLTGADLPGLLGHDPAELSAWRYEAEGSWTQIPLQVDERALIDLGEFDERGGADAPVMLFYADPALQPDPDPTLDEDDEVVFMARDAGLAAAPAGTKPAGVTGAGQVVRIADPLQPLAQGFIYIFDQAATMADPAYVTYLYVDLTLPANPNAGDGKELENRAAPDPFDVNTTVVIDEDSTVTTPYYSHHFSARWRLDEMHLLAAGGDSGDLLDRYAVQLAPDDCGRSENTFSAGRGAFIVNRSGRVRAIRAYIGANSGPYTQRLHLFYDQRHDVITTVRVHAINGITEFFDYSAAAVGMTYYSNLAPAGVLVDGVADRLPTGSVNWELMSGSAGSVISLHSVTTDIPDLNHSSYYQDDANPVAPPCAGDGSAIGASGPYYFPIPCTDPMRAAVDPSHCDNVFTLQLQRTILYAAPNLAAPAAAAAFDGAAAPLTSFVEAWP